MVNNSINRIKVALAEQMGKSEITISRWVQNKSQPSLEQLLQIPSLLSVIPKDLINEF